MKPQVGNLVYAKSEDGYCYCGYVKTVGKRESEIVYYQDDTTESVGHQNILVVDWAMYADLPDGITVKEAREYKTKQNPLEYWQSLHVMEVEKYHLDSLLVLAQHYIPELTATGTMDQIKLEVNSEVRRAGVFKYSQLPYAIYSISDKEVGYYSLSIGISKIHCRTARQVMDTFLHELCHLMESYHGMVEAVKAKSASKYSEVMRWDHGKEFFSYEPLIQRMGFSLESCCGENHEAAKGDSHKIANLPYRVNGTRQIALAWRDGNLIVVPVSGSASSSMHRMQMKVILEGGLNFRNVKFVETDRDLRVWGVNGRGFSPTSKRVSFQKLPLSHAEGMTLEELAEVLSAS